MNGEAVPAPHVTPWRVSQAWQRPILVSPASKRLVDASSIHRVQGYAAQPLDHRPFRCKLTGWQQEEPGGHELGII